MKKFLAIVLAVLFVSTTSSLVLAQSTQTTPVTKTHQTSKKKTHKKKHHTKKTAVKKTTTPTA